jgi:hypothetical protein
MLQRSKQQTRFWLKIVFTLLGEDFLLLEYRSS